MSQRNARFWAYKNGGWVKLTIRPGQSLSWGTSSEDEEGWSWEYVTWSHEGDCVKMVSAGGGTDCDGRVEYYQDLECSIDRLSAYHVVIDDRFEQSIPDWEVVSRSQRDWRAEAAGY